MFYLSVDSEWGYYHLVEMQIDNVTLLVFRSFISIGSLSSGRFRPRVCSLSLKARRLLLVLLKMGRLSFSLIRLSPIMRYIPLQNRLILKIYYKSPSNHNPQISIQNSTQWPEDSAETQSGTNIKISNLSLIVDSPQSAHLTKTTKW